MPKLTFTGDVRGFLRSVPLFKDLSAEDLNQVADAMDVKVYPANACIFQQGTKGDQFYVVTQGEAFVKVTTSHFIQVGEDIRLARDVKIAKTVYPRGTPAVVDKFDAARGYPFTVRIVKTGDRGRCLPEEIEAASGDREERIIASCRPGDYFGEAAILKGSYRNATVIASPQGGQLSLACLSKEKFERLNLGTRLHFAKRKAVVAAQEIAHQEADMRSRDTQKTKDQAEMISRAIDTNKHLHDLVHLSADDRYRMVEAAYRRQIKSGDIVIHEGELFAHEFFVVEKGAFQFSISQKYGSEHDKITQFGLMGEARPGSSFGELALLHNAPRSCTVQAIQDSVVWVVDRQMFRKILENTFAKKMQEYMRVISSINIFSSLLQDEKAALCEQLNEKHFIKGEALVQAGKDNDVFFILLSGTISKGGKRVSQPGTYFGEYAILKKQPSQETILADSEDVHVACVSQHEFERLLAPLEEIMLEARGGERESRLNRAPDAGVVGMTPIKVRRSEFKKIGLLGCGGFGAVTLEQAPDGQCYAMKQLSKGYVLKMKMQKSVMNEKSILMMCNSKFVVKCFATYNTDQSLYFLLEPAMGGELYATYHKYRFHGNATKARFYAASTLLALEHLHQRHVLYRDLKPENLLLDNDGRCKLTDMGLAKQTTVKTYTTCGTPDYFAPEVIDQKTGQNEGVDWWTLGVLIHELMSGHAPFEAPNPMQIYQKVVRGVSGVNFPYQGSDPAAVAIVKAMLQKQASDRLAMLPGGITNFQNHAWYANANFNWAAHEAHKNEVPHKPQIKSMTDMSNFRAREADIPPQLPYKDPGDGWDREFATAAN